MVVLSLMKSVRLHTGGADRKMDAMISSEEQSWGFFLLWFGFWFGLILFGLGFFGRIFSFFLLFFCSMCHCHSQQGT